MSKKKSKTKKYNKDVYGFAIIGLLLSIASIYTEKYLDFSYIFALSYEDKTFLSIIYLLLGFSSLSFWTMSLGFVMVTRFNININEFFNYDEKVSKLNDTKFKLDKSQNYSYLAILSLFFCFVFTLMLRPSNYISLRDHLISLL